MSSPRHWTLIYTDDVGGPGHSETHWGTVEAEGGVVHVVTYSGGVGGFPRPQRERVIPLARLYEWRSDE